MINDALSLYMMSSLQRSDQIAATANQRISSGKRINTAQDDAAGSAVVTRFNSETIADAKIQQSLMDGVSYSQIAQGGLSKITDIIQRARELAVQAANDTYSASDRANLQMELDKQISFIDSIVYQTEFNGIHPLVGNGTSEHSNSDPLDGVLKNGVKTFKEGQNIYKICTIPAGSKNVKIDLDSLGLDDDIQIFNKAGKHLYGTPSSDKTWESIGNTDSGIQNNILTPANGFDSNAVYDGSSLASAGDGDINNSGDIDSSPESPYESVNIPTTTEDLIFMISSVNSSMCFITATWDQLGLPSSSVDLAEPDPVRITASNQLLTQSDLGYIDIDKTPSKISDLGVLGLKLDPVTQAKITISNLDAALDKLDKYKAYHGAKTNELVQQFSQVNQYSNNIQSSRSKIEDADLAKEITESTSASIVKNSAMAMLTQAYKINKDLVMGILKN